MPFSRSVRKPLPPRSGRRCAAALLILALVAPTVATAKEDKFPGIRKLMNDEQFEAAGLDRLNPEQLKHLDAWLLEYTAGEATVLREQNPEVREVQSAFNLEASVADFRGWSGDTLFRLDNGQIWKQRLDGRFAYGGDDHRVRIERNFMGYFRLVHVATGRAVGVTRLR